MATITLTNERPFDYGMQKFYDILEGGEIVGKVNVLEYDTGEIHVDRIDVDAEHRGQRIETQVLTENFSGAYVVPDNARAAALYERIGSEIRVNDEFSALDEGFGVFTID